LLEKARAKGEEHRCSVISRRIKKAKAGRRK